MLSFCLQSTVSRLVSIVPTPDVSTVIDLDSADSDPIVLHRTVEKVSPVIPKYLQKATVPPVTIKQFFKPKRPLTTLVSATAESAGCTGRPSDQETVQPAIPQQSAVKEDVANENCNSVESDLESTVTRAQCRTSVSAKRSSSSTKLVVAKKPKQGSIMSLMTKSKDSKQQKTMKCPICDTLFESNVSNEEFNKHIDSCLIE